MSDFRIKEIVIVGGGTAGWIAASVLSKFLGEHTSIKLIESDQIGTVGVGEATIPQILRLNGMLGLSEAEFMRATNATIKLGIEFNNWGHVGESYLHTFGSPGIDLSHVYFHHYWLRSALGGQKSSLWDYSLHHRAAYQNRFNHLPRVGQTQMGGLSYAYHFDSTLYGQYLRRFAETQGVKRIEGKVVDVNLHTDTGNIISVTMENGDSVEGDFFIDCTGFRGLLIGEALGVKYLDWSKWLPCNRAVAVACERSDPLLPYTKSTAHEAGWQWRIPLQHRTGNGHVFCSDFVEPDQATDTLVQNLDASIMGEPRLLKFTTGRREKFWHKNCVAFGLSGGFLEPLESTSIHLIQSNVSKLMELFPTQEFSDTNVSEYNRQVQAEFDLIKDFLILHYNRTDREDTEFWRYCKNMEVPADLKSKTDMFEATGLVHKDHHDLFGESSWVQVMHGQGLMPRAYHAMADRLSDEQLTEFLTNVKKIVRQAVDTLPVHSEFISSYCPAQQ